MAERDNSINNLDSDRWNRLDDLASQLERSWRKGPVDLASILPDEGDPLRPHALRELVKVDMEMRWRKGEPAKLDYYVETYKELGPLKTLPPTLIFEEYRVRQLFGDRPELQSYQKRFPTQYPDLQKILTEQPLPTMQPGGTNAATELHTPGTPTASMKVPTLTGVVLKQMGGHRLISRLGSGAFGEVWKAEAPGGIMKAVKVIFRPIDHEEARRELESLELIKNLRHHFLLSTHSFLPIEDRLYILMDLADCSVRDRLRACVKEGQSGIPLLELIKYLREAAEALDYLHEKGVQHRDVKPENILVCEGVVRVADFGLARSQVNRQLTNGSGAGTPVYMPPEAWNDKIHQNSDQYSLAATYAECRVARRLFDVEGIPRLMAAHLTTTPALEGLSEPERKVLHRALSKNPDHRYPSCVAFAEALEEAVAPQLPEGALKRFARGSGAKRLSARDRGLIAGGIALLLVAAATLGYVFWPRVGDLELATNNPSVEIAVLETQPLSLSFNRNGNTEPIVLTAVDPPPDIKLGEPVAESESVTVPITVNQDAAFGERELTFNAAAGDRTTEVKAKLKIVPLRTLPRPTQTAGIYLPAPGTDVVEVGGRLYYRRIECRLGPPSNLVVRFRFIPWTERGKSSFYIMEDKVTNALYGEFARENPGAVSGSRWRLGARLKDMNLAAVPQTLDLIFGTLPGAPNWQAIQATEFDPLSSFVQPHWPQPGDLGAGEATWPVLRVDVQEAARFAEWMGGLLPSVEQWDKAAGRFEKNPGIGPFREGFGKDDIAIGRADRGPLPVGVASHDVSVFGVRDMAGNGLEWTRSLLRAGERSEFIGDVNRVPLDAAVPLRGRDFSHEEPLDFASLDEGGLHVAFWQGTPDRNRTCAYESRIGFRIILP